MTALLYPGCLNAFTAEPANGKTMVALVAAAQLLEQGKSVLYIDYEGNRRIVGDRLRALGVKPDQAGVERCPYVRPGFIGPGERAALTELARRVKPALVVIDGVAKSLARQGLSEDKAPDVLAWMELLCWPFTAEGAAVLTLDHVVKDKENQGRWARGSSAKLGEIDGASYMLRGRFSREKPGSVRLILTKDREGHIGEEGKTAAVVHFTPHDGRLDYRIERPSESAEQRFVPTDCMEKIHGYLAAHKGQWFAQEAIVEGVKPMRKATAVAAIAELVRSGQVHVNTEQRWARYGVPSHMTVVPDDDDELF